MGGVVNSISVGEAVSAGFKVIGRAPLAFAAWCGVVFVVYGLPQFLMFSSLGPVFEAAARGRGMVVVGRRVRARGHA